MNTKEKWGLLSILLCLWFFGGAACGGTDEVQVQFAVDDYSSGLVGNPGQISTSCTGKPAGYAIPLTGERRHTYRRSVWLDDCPPFDPGINGYCTSDILQASDSQGRYLVERFISPFAEVEVWPHFEFPAGWNIRIKNVVGVSPYSPPSFVSMQVPVEVRADGSATILATVSPGNEAVLTVTGPWITARLPPENLLSGHARFAYLQFFRICP